MNYSKFSGLIACKMAMLLAFMFAACSEDSAVSPLAQDGGYTEEQASLENVKVVAYARSYESVVEDSTTTKFVSSIVPGSIVRLTELDSVTFNATGLVYYSRTEDSSGVFSFDSISLKSPYVMLELSASCGLKIEGVNDGWLNGCTDNARKSVVYSMIADLRKSKNVGINVMTTMVTRRLLGLMTTGLSFEAAKQQSENELLKALGIYGVPYRFDKAVSDDSRAEMLFMDYLGDWLEFKNADRSALGVASVFSKLGSFNESPAVKNYFVESILEWFESEWVSEDTKAYLHDYMHNFMASLWGLGQCATGNDGYSTTLPFNERQNIDFVCDKEAWSYFVHYVVPDSIGAVFGEMADSRDGAKYKTVAYDIGGKTQTWLAENLKYESADGVYFWNEAMGLPDSVALIPYETCIEENTYKKCDQLQADKINLDYERILAITDSVKAAGKTYQGICPDGWHLPDMYEWKTLFGYVSEKIDIRSLENADAMAIAGFGESDSWNGTSYAVKIDTTDQGITGSPYLKSLKLWVHVKGENWSFISLDRRDVRTEYKRQNAVYVRCVKN